MKFNEFYSLTIVHSRDIILVKGVDYMNITKQKSQNLLVPIDYAPINKILDGWKSKSVDYMRQYL